MAERVPQVTVDVLVTPRASREKVGPMVGDRLKVAVTSPPVEGEANGAVIELLARTFGIPKASVTIVRGEGSRRKTIRISGVTSATLDAILKR
ncbi:MAG: YggU family protein [Deltaproteobacteria bacterium]|nr:YggU family protein [Deltaproteobacteria bacterium]